MSPIETVWKWISQKLRARVTLAMTLEEQQAIIQELWDKVEQPEIDELIIGYLNARGERVKSMQDRWEDLYQCNGQPTGH